MTPFEIISLILLWVIVGTWISYKRNWYEDLKNNNTIDQGSIAANIIFAPLVLVIVLIFRLFVEPWEKE